MNRERDRKRQRQWDRETEIVEQQNIKLKSIQFKFSYTMKWYFQDSK